jgi:hypothetical protein
MGFRTSGAAWLEVSFCCFLIRFSLYISWAKRDFLESDQVPPSGIERELTHLFRIWPDGHSY